MRQHLSSAKQKATSNLQIATCCSEGNDNANTLSSIKELSKQIAEIQSQLVKLAAKPKAQTSRNALNSKQKEKPKLEKVTKEPERTSKTQSSAPRAWYCFQCGEDGHIKPYCENEPNPGRVAEKRKLLKEKQKKWEAENPSAAKEQLN